MRQSGSNAGDSGSARGLVLTLSLGLGIMLSAGCETNCKKTCEKLLECGEGIDTPRASQDDCEYACGVQYTLYKDNWENPYLLEEFNDMRSCIVDEECSTIADGACYDDELYIW